jgi:hypothetical protein
MTSIELSMKFDFDAALSKKEKRVEKFFKV